MNSVIDRFLGDSVPARERMFYLGTFLSSFFSLLFVSVAVLLRMDWLTVLVYASISAVGTVFFFLEQKINKPFILTVIYLIYINLICFPGLLIISPKDLIEVPIYSICGLVYTLVLLDGKARIIMYIVQVITDMSVAYYRFVVMNSPGIHMGPSTALDYLRIEAAIIITGILCGCIIRFRHYTFRRTEINNKNDKSLIRFNNQVTALFIMDYTYIIKFLTKCLIQATFS